MAPGILGWFQSMLDWLRRQGPGLQGSCVLGRSLLSLQSRAGGKVNRASLLLPVLARCALQTATPLVTF